MPSTIGKNLNLCFKCPSSTNSSSLLTNTPDDDSRRPLFTSTAAATATATSTASSHLFKNYNSLYDNTFDEYYTTSNGNSKPLLLTHSSSPVSDSEPDFASVFASQRFFFTSPGSSNSIIESTPSTSTSTSTSTSSDTAINQSSSNYRTTSSSIKDSSVAVSTLSPNPFMDFRRSMQEMVEARGVVVVDDVKANWDYLHELLLCYLAMNPKSTHKFIIAAFADLLVSLMAAAGSGAAGNDGGDNITDIITGGKINPGRHCM